MRCLRYSLLLTVFLLPSVLSAQQRGIEIGLDGGVDYALDADLLIIAVPFQRVRAAFPSGTRLAFEPSLSFTRLSTDGASLATLIFQVGALYELVPTRTATYARPFAGLEYADASFADAETVFDLGVGFGTRSRIADRLSLRIEATVTGRFGESGGTDGVLGASLGLSFFTR